MERHSRGVANARSRTVVMRRAGAANLDFGRACARHTTVGAQVVRIVGLYDGSVLEVAIRGEVGGQRRATPPDNSIWLVNSGLGT